MYYVHYDPRGAPVALTDESGSVVWTAEVDPFGGAKVDEDPDGDGMTIEFNARLPGQYYDKETGLHYNYHRYYDPKTGRYLTSDPIGINGGLNTYSYAYGNPIKSIDPSGLNSFDSMARDLTGMNPNSLPITQEHAQSTEARGLLPGENVLGNYGKVWFAFMTSIGALQAAPGLSFGMMHATGSRICSAGFNQTKEFALTNPANIIDFTSSLFPGIPAPNYFGLAGFSAGAATNPHEILR